MFMLSRINVPQVSLGVVQETGFTPGDTEQWAPIFALAVRQARASGVALRGRIRIAENMIARVLGPGVTMEQSVQLLVTLSTQWDGLEIWGDQNLSNDTAVID